MRLDTFFCSQGVFALTQLVAFSVSGLCASASDDTFQPESGTNAPAALRQALSLLDQLHREQRLLQDAIDRLGARQDASFDQQAKAVREQRRELAGSLLLQRDQEMEALNAIGRTTITAACIVAGLLLFAVAGVAWSLVRMLQRISARVLQVSSIPIALPQAVEAGASTLMQTRMAAAIEQLERSLLSLESAVVRIAPSPVVAEGARRNEPIRREVPSPVRSQIRGLSPTVVPMPAESLPGDFV